jgi:hypothetical protein
MVTKTLGWIAKSDFSSSSSLYSCEGAKKGPYPDTSFPVIIGSVNTH